MEMERLVLMVSEKKQRKIIPNLKKNFVEGEKYNDKNVLKLDFFSSYAYIRCIYKISIRFSSFHLQTGCSLNK